MADIDIQPSALTDFARNSQLDLDTDSLQGLASAASTGQSQLPGGTQLFETQRASIQQVLAFLAEARDGERACRDGADALAALYTDADGKFAQNLNAVPTQPPSGSSPTPGSPQA